MSLKIFISPGHDKDGRRDPGAVHPYRGTRESDIADKVGQKLKEYLINAGVDVIGYLQDDDLYWVVETVDNSGCDVAISLHCNAFNGVANGVECCVYDLYGESAKIAKYIQKQLVDSLDLTDRGLKERPGLLFLNSTTCPSVLVEMAFIDNDHDEELLSNKSDEFAAAIARGITDYIDNM